MCQGLTAKDITIPSIKIITSEGTGSPSKSARVANEAKAPEQVVCPLYSGRVPQRLIASYIIASHVLVVARAVASHVLVIARAVASASPSSLPVQICRFTCLFH